MLKSTMNARDIRRFHKMLEKDFSVKECSAHLKIEVKTLNKFTPEKVKAAAAKARKIAAETRKGPKVVKTNKPDPEPNPENVSDPEKVEEDK